MDFLKKSKYAWFLRYLVKTLVDRSVTKNVKLLRLFLNVASPNDTRLHDDIKHVKSIGETKDCRQPLAVVTFRYDDDKKVGKNCV